MPDPTTKPCSRCGETKPLDAFSPHKGGRFGRHSQCKACHSERRRLARQSADPSVEQARRRARYEQADKAAIAQYVRAYRKAHPERTRELDARRRERHGEAIRARKNDWGAANRERIKAQNQAYYAGHREQERQRTAQYKATHRDEQRSKGRARRDAAPEKYKAATRAWRAANPDKAHEVRARYRARKSDAYVAPVDRGAIYERDGGRCGICHKPVSRGAMQFDHIIPLARGGTHEPKNVQVAHPLCNQRKHATGPGQLRLLE